MPVLSRTSFIYVPCLALCCALLLGTSSTARAASFPVTNTDDSGAGSLRQAILDAEGAAGADTITFSVSGTITLGSALPNITDAAGLTIDGTGQAVVISGGDTVRPFEVDAGASLELQALTVTNGRTTTQGGALWNAGTVTVTGMTFTLNQTSNNTGRGGAIFNTGTLTVTGGAFTTNSAGSAASARGGAIYNEAGGQATVTGATFTGNSTGGGASGGAIFNAGTLTSVTGATFTGNTAGAGGAIVQNAAGQLMTVADSTFTGNTASNGGAIFIGAGPLTVTGSTFSANTAGAGGAIYNATVGTVTTVTNSTFSGNAATSTDGGAIYVTGTGMTLTNTTLTGNSATMQGGGVRLQAGPRTLTLTNTIIANSPSGGDCWNDGGTLNGTNNLIADGSCAADLPTAIHSDPLLGALASNGGPTQTMALQPGSPALGAGATCAATDQRGITRSVATCDIGAYEALRLSIADRTQAEGSSGTSTFNFVVTLSQALPAGFPSVAVQYDTASGTATAPGDYTAVAGGTVTFTAGGAATQNAAVTVNGDVAIEPDEDFTVTLSNPVRALIATAVATGTITNDDAVPSSLAVDNAGDAADATPGDGICATAGPVCTLRAAIEEANALAGAQTITFSASGTITLTSALPNITDAAGLTIDGTGQAVTISGGDTVRPFEVDAGASLELQALTVTNGRTTTQGGALRNAGTVTLTDMTFTLNQATNNAGRGGAIYNVGTLTVTGATFSANTAGTSGGAGSGGAIHVDGTSLLTVTGSTFSANTADEGGGVFMANGSGDLTVTRSTFSANTAGYGGGGIDFGGTTLTVTESTFSSNTVNDGAGGGIYFEGTTLTVTESTFSGNTANDGGGIKMNAGSGTLTSSTLSGNSATGAAGGGAGIWVAFTGALTVTNTIIANSTVGDDCANDNGTLSGTNNIVADGSCAADLPTAIHADPLLGALAANGGPTQTMALLAGSPALGAGAGCAATDQRGIARSVATCDIGAYEVLRLSVADRTQAEGDAGGTTFNFPVTLSSALPAGFPSVAVQYDTANGTATVPGDYTAVVAGTVTFTAGGAATQNAAVTVNGDVAVEADETFTLTLSNAAGAMIATAVATGTISNDDAVPSSLAVDNAGDAADATPGDGICATAGPVCTLRAAIEEANALAGAQTITFSASGTITLTSALPNITDAAGLTIDGTGQAVTISGGDTVRPFEVDAGASLELQALTVTNGRTTTQGGALWNAGTVTLTDMTFTLNQTSNNTGRGGAIFNTGTLTVTGGAFTTNSAGSAASARGGAIYNEAGGQATVTGATFTGNSTGGGGAGGAIFNAGTLTSVTGATFTGNTAGVGGAIGQNAAGQLMTVADSTFSANTANTTGAGGGGIYFAGTTLTVTESTFSANTAGTGGGGIYFEGTTLTVTESTFSGNTANDGGGIKMNAGSGTLTSSTLSGNSATGAAGGGAGIWVAFTGALTVTNTIIANSTVGDDCANDNGTLSGTNNIVADGSCAADLPTAIHADPLLGALAANGGPTQTMALLAGSPALGAGAGCAATDQRGIARSVATCDIGAYEVLRLSVADRTQAEGDAGGTTFNFPVTLSSALPAGFPSVAVQYDTANGTATVPGDYTAVVAGTVTFTAGGAATQNAAVTVNGDVAVEADETFTLTLSNAAGAMIATAVATGTISNDDAAPDALVMDSTGDAEEPGEPSVPQVPGVTFVNGVLTGVDLTGPLEIQPGGVIDGGRLRGRITNRGRITGTITLGPDTVIEGGIVSGNITGAPDSPALILDADIPAGTRLENVVIGEGTVLDPEVILGPNVTFDSNALIPPGIDLTGALPVLQGEFHTAPDLRTDVVDGAPGDEAPNILEQLGLLEDLAGFAISQLDSGELVIAGENSRSVLLPRHVSQAGPGTAPGVYADADGNLVFVTAGGRQVTAAPVLTDLPFFLGLLELRGLSLVFDADNPTLFRVFPAQGGFYYVGRAGAAAVPAFRSQQPGLHAYTLEEPANVTGFSVIFVAGNGVLMEQDLVPMPTDWDALRERLAAAPALSDIRLDENGVISVLLNGARIEGRAGYVVTLGEPSGSSSVILQPAGDLNGDGTGDYYLRYPNGETQVLYVYPQ